MRIEDGTGDGYSAKVAANNRLTTESVTLSAEDDAIREGRGWQITSGAVSFTGVSGAGLLYIKNTGAVDLVLDRVVLVLGTATGAAAGADWTFQTLRNPTSGTLISGAVASGISNSNHGSARTPSAAHYAGTESSTVTDGTGVALPIKQDQNRSTFPLARRLPLGSSIAWKVTPPTGTTAATVAIVAHVYDDTSGL